jgi:hypothetical protein
VTSCADWTKKTSCLAIVPDDRKPSLNDSSFRAILKKKKKKKRKEKKRKKGMLLLPLMNSSASFYYSLISLEPKCFCIGAT